MQNKLRRQAAPGRVSTGSLEPGLGVRLQATLLAPTVSADWSALDAATYLSPGVESRKALKVPCSKSRRPALDIVSVVMLTRVA